MSEADPKRTYEVGYRKPPAAHQFKKGQSGNPKGRAKGRKNNAPPGQGLDFGTQPANQMLLEEAYRTISVARSVTGDPNRPPMRSDRETFQFRMTVRVQPRHYEFEIVSRKKRPTDAAIRDEYVRATLLQIEAPHP